MYKVHIKLVNGSESDRIMEDKEMRYFFRDLEECRETDPEAQEEIKLTLLKKEGGRVIHGGRLIDGQFPVPDSEKEKVMPVMNPIVLDDKGQECLLVPTSPEALEKMMKGENVTTGYKVPSGKAIANTDKKNEGVKLKKKEKGRLREMLIERGIKDKKDNTWVRHLVDSTDISNFDLPSDFVGLTFCAKSNKIKLKRIQQVVPL